MLKNKTVSIIIPVYNEERTVDKVLGRLFSLKLGGWKKHLIVVNDGSTDGTLAKIKSFVNTKSPPNFKLISHSKNLGKGAAIQSGIKMASGEATIIQDADLEYNPADIAKLIKVYETRHSKVVFGFRKKSKNHSGHKSFIWGARLLTFFANLFLQTKLKDVYTGYKLINTRLLKSLALKSPKFEIDMELIVKLLRRGEPIIEVPISYHPRTIKEGKKLRFWDGYRALKVIFLSLLQK